MLDWFSFIFHEKVWLLMLGLDVVWKFIWKGIYASNFESKDEFSQCKIVRKEGNNVEEYVIFAILHLSFYWEDGDKCFYCLNHL